LVTTFTDGKISIRGDTQLFENAMGNSRWKFTPTYQLSYFLEVSGHEPKPDLVCIDFVARVTMPSGILGAAACDSGTIMKAACFPANVHFVLTCSNHSKFQFDPNPKVGNPWSKFGNALSMILNPPFLSISLLLSKTSLDWEIKAVAYVREGVVLLFWYSPWCSGRASVPSLSICETWRLGVLMISRNRAGGFRSAVRLYISHAAFPILMRIRQYW
jgi:hypothetical protein